MNEDLLQIVRSNPGRAWKEMPFSASLEIVGSKEIMFPVVLDDTFQEITPALIDEKYGENILAGHKADLDATEYQTICEAISYNLNAQAEQLVKDVTEHIRLLGLILDFLEKENWTPAIVAFHMIVDKLKPYYEHAWGVDWQGWLYGVARYVDEKAPQIHHVLAKSILDAM